MKVFQLETLDGTIKKVFAHVVEHGYLNVCAWWDVCELLKVLFKNPNAAFLCYQICWGIAKQLDNALVREAWAERRPVPIVRPPVSVPPLMSTKATRIQNWSAYDRNRVILKYMSASKAWFNKATTSMINVSVDGANLINGRSALFGMVIDKDSVASWLCPTEPQLLLCDAKCMFLDMPKPSQQNQGFSIGHSVCVGTEHKHTSTKLSKRP